MTDEHEFQDINYHGVPIKACKFCGVQDSPASAEAAKMPCPKKQEMLIAAGVMTQPPSDERGGNSARPGQSTLTSAVDFIKNLNAAEIEAKIAEMRGEIAGLEVLLAAARARDGKATNSVSQN